MKNFSFRERLALLQKEIEKSASRAGQNPENIVLVVITKGVEVSRIREAWGAGIRVIGENRVQEAAEKFAVLSGQSDLEWHLIGHLQRNKVKVAIKFFDFIQSLDSWELAQEINRRAGEQGKIQDCLVEVNISGESQKYGLAPGQLNEFLSSMEILKNVRVQGLMAIGPLRENPEEVRPYFRQMRQMFTDCGRRANELREMRYLSLGMSADFRIAIEEGANMIRVGNFLFGERIQSDLASRVDNDQETG